MNKRLTLNGLLAHSDLGVAIALLAMLVVMILPMPAFLLDLLLVLSLALSIGILLMSVYAAKPLDFSVFPTVLLFSTLFRLALNVASTRLVLLRGHEGAGAAGSVIETFGNLVVGGSYVVGAVVFALLIVINFVVITKGSGRVAEVAARFMLDSMPGKQMSIDADLNAGLITEDQARDRRRKVEQEADFYGAMDGASKFVRGDAIAGILITVINIVGGLSIGVLQRGLDVGKAAELYTIMTIGDGLVSQIPSLIVSTAAGIIVTRAASSENFSSEVARQILLQPRALSATAGILCLLGIIPGIPAFPFLAMASVLGGFAWAVARAKAAETRVSEAESRRAVERAGAETSAPPEVDVLELQVGYGLVGSVEGEGKSELVDRIFQLRREFAKDLGVVVPKVRIKDNLELEPNAYAILIRGVAVGKGELISGHVLAMDPGGVVERVSGIETREPVFGLAAVWVHERARDKAQAAGYTVVDGPTIIATHMSEIIRRHAHELLGRQELQALIDNLKRTHPKVVEELIPTLLSLGAVLRVCQNLLREQVPIRDLASILECLANQAGSQKDPDALTENVRGALARTISHRLSGGGGEIEVLTFAPATEEAILRAYQRADGQGSLQLEPGVFERLVQQLQAAIEKTVFSAGSPVLLCHPLVRGPLRRLLERFVPGLNLISANEIALQIRVKAVGSVG